MMRTSLSILLLALVSGCASSPTPRYDARFGEAVRQARQMMTINPNAGATTPVVGMDGKAAAEALDRYHDAFKAPPPVVNVINIGGAVGGTK
jgi:uncharacterized lipoprotein